ncbi:WD repeat-containing protein 12, partial [Perkinsus olseni]
MCTSDHSGDVNQTMFGSEASKGTSRGHSGKVSEVEGMLSGGRPSLKCSGLKRLKFLVSWAKLQVEESMPYMQRALSSGDNARTTQQASRLEKILDEVIMSFSPWVQQQYLVRAEKDKAKQQRGMRLIKIHLAPLYRFLGGEAVYKAVSFCNAEFLARWESGDVDPDSVLQRCRGVFPTVLETVVIIRSAAATLGASSAKTSNKATQRGHSKSGDGDVAQRSRSGSLLGGGSTLADRRVSDTVDWITTFLRRSIKGNVLFCRANCKNRGDSFASVKPSKSTAAPSEGLAVGAALDDEEEEVQPVEFPPLGAELELDEDQYYSASEGEESDGEAERFQRLHLRSGSSSK